MQPNIRESHQSLWSTKDTEKLVFTVCRRKYCIVFFGGGVNIIKRHYKKDTFL